MQNKARLKRGNKQITFQRGKRKTVTLTIDPDEHKKAKIKLSKQNISLSKFLDIMLELYNNGELIIKETES